MAKDKLEEFIKRETQGPSIGEVATKAAIAGALVGAVKVLGTIFGKKG